MNKLHFMKFNTGDWTVQTRSLSRNARAAWIDILCALHKSKHRGIRTFSIAAWSRIIMFTEQETNEVFEELSSADLCEMKRECNGDVTLSCEEILSDSVTTEQTRLRVEKHRRLKLSVFDPPSTVNNSSNGNVTDMKRECNGDVTDMKRECNGDVTGKKIEDRNKKIEEKEKKKISIFDSLPKEFDVEILRKAWDDWQIYRKERKLSSYTKIGITKTANIFIEIGSPTECTAAIDRSIAQNYNGIFKQNQNYGQKNTATSNRNTGSSNEGRAALYATPR